jgi:hypothetical protein
LLAGEITKAPASLTLRLSLTNPADGSGSWWVGPNEDEAIGGDERDDLTIMRQLPSSPPVQLTG